MTEPDDDDALQFHFGHPPWAVGNPLADAARVPTPVGKPCLMCAEPIAEGDSGQFNGGDPRGKPMHIECLALSTIGHTFGVCGCHGFEPGRPAALELWRRLRKVG